MGHPTSTGIADLLPERNEDRFEWRYGFLRSHVKLVLGREKFLYALLLILGIQILENSYIYSMLFETFNNILKIFFYWQEIL
jgi:hypothetical protein